MHCHWSAGLALSMLKTTHTRTCDSLHHPIQRASDGLSNVRRLTDVFSFISRLARSMHITHTYTHTHTHTLVHTHTHVCQAPTLSLEKEAQRIEDKRARNVARTARYLDARLRTIGLDTDALDEQIREQRAREERERVRRSTALDVILLDCTSSYSAAVYDKRSRRQVRSTFVVMFPVGPPDLSLFAYMSYSEWIASKQGEHLCDRVACDSTALSGISVCMILGVDSKQARRERERAFVLSCSLRLDGLWMILLDHTYKPEGWLKMRPSLSTVGYGEGRRGKRVRQQHLQ